MSYIIAGYCLLQLHAMVPVRLETSIIIISFDPRIVSVFNQICLSSSKTTSGETVPYVIHFKLASITLPLQSRSLHRLRFYLSLFNLVAHKLTQFCKHSLTIVKTPRVKKNTCIYGITRWPSSGNFALTGAVVLWSTLLFMAGQLLTL